MVVKPSGFGYLLVLRDYIAVWISKRDISFSRREWKLNENSGSVTLKKKESANCSLKGCEEE